MRGTKGWNSNWYDPLIEDELCNIRHSTFLWPGCPVSLLYWCVTTTMKWFPVVGFGRGPKVSIATNSRNLLVGAEQFQVTLLPEARLVFSAFTAESGCRVKVIVEIWPVRLLCLSVVRARLAGVSRQFRIMRKVQEGWSKEVWYYSLNGAVGRGGLNQDGMRVLWGTRAGVLTVPFTWWQKASWAWFVRSSCSMGVVLSTFFIVTIQQ